MIGNCSCYGCISPCQRYLDQCVRSRGLVAARPLCGGRGRLAFGASVVRLAAETRVRRLDLRELGQRVGDRRVEC